MKDMIKTWLQCFYLILTLQIVSKTLNENLKEAPYSLISYEKNSLCEKLLLSERSELMSDLLKIFYRQINAGNLITLDIEKWIQTLVLYKNIPSMKTNLVLYEKWNIQFNRIGKITNWNKNIWKWIARSDMEKRNLRNKKWHKTEKVLSS